ncbi:hypothetical protein WR25_15736 isoform B [Diploscapter pachys]|uniref:FERM domain-containing protein n=1 Tax=Diploscapter pachys TaxID=2018661 RepID=A0A2A2KZ04_9BILA|nr:hypothetical protein WR25_15736 isoform A [Diploscapter pachys]PAV79053.1 hypothetical protein WR25_15736 isoform B [Diploscapter pachys]
MASLALKVDRECDCSGDFRPEQYFPLWVINERGLEYVRKNMPAACEDLKDMKRHQAMIKFATEASRQPFALNCHLYGLRRHKMDTADNAVLAINARGIEMCDIGVQGERIPLRSLCWSRVTRLSFDRKKLTIIGSDGTKMSLYAQSDSKTRYLLELCRAVHQTLLVMQHLYAGKAPIPQPYQEKSVDRLSTSSNTTSGIASGDAEKDCDSLSSACDHRGQGSTSSKQRDRIRIDSNLELKFERMQQLDSIRQERAASQSSEISENSIERAIERRADLFLDLPHPLIINEQRMLNGIDNRPSSVDSTSSFQPPDLMTRSVPVDVNYNTKFGQRADAAEQLLTGTGGYSSNVGSQLHYTADGLLYRSSSGSRSNSVQHSNEILPELLANTNGFHHSTQNEAHLNAEDAESTLRSTATIITTTAPATSTVGTNTGPIQSSSLHDLRTAGLYQTPLQYVEASAPSVSVKMPVIQSVSIDQVQAQARAQQTRSYSPPSQQQWMQMHMSQMQIRNGNIDPRFDSEFWINPSVSSFIDCAPGPSNGRFTKKTPQPTRIAHPISRVQSMPSHYHNHLNTAYNVRNIPLKDQQITNSLHHAHSLYAPTRPKNPPPYEHPHRLDLDSVQYTPAGLPAEAAGGQPAFPPASATAAHFNQDNFFRDKEEMTEVMSRPLLRQLLHENKNMVSAHHRRPSSSCIDLTSTGADSCQPGGSHVSVYSNGGIRNANGNGYFIDSASLGFTPNGVVQKENTTNGFTMLPPPPSYVQRPSMVM